MLPAKAAPRVTELVTFAHVADVGASLDFYALLGFSERNSLKGHDGVRFWAWADSIDPASRVPTASIMFARASGPVDASVQAVLFYMYCDDVLGLRERLLAGGLADGGVFTGSPGPSDGRRVVFSITHPSYMPLGELRVSDPDGYCILIGQRG
ncbi:MAG: hypothetical protein K2Y21_08080 [Phycisphaerales bacterium]|nr:hypothetical protein [Phycisphaerales bacterium]